MNEPHILHKPTCKNYTENTWSCLAGLNNTPGTGELLGLDNAVAEDLRGVEVAAKEESIDASTHGVAIEPTHEVQTEHGEC